MSLQPFLAELHSREIQLWADGDRLRCKAPTGVLTSKLRDQLLERKSEILELLRTAEAVSRQQRAVVPLQPRGTRPPVFAVPGHAGDVFGYRALALHIGDDQPFFGLEPPGLDGSSAPLESVEELAEYFAVQIREFHPAGPCIIAGHCAGGAIAFELARQLQARGTEVRLLVLFACPYPAYYGFMGQIRQKVRLGSARIYRHVRTLMTLSFPEARRYVAAKLHRRKLQRDSGRAAAQEPVLIRRAAVMRATVAAVCRYVPGNYAGSVSMILPNRNWLHSGAEPLRWQSAVPQAEVCFGPEGCDPDLLLVDPDAPAIADLFRKCRDRGVVQGPLAMTPLAMTVDASVRATARVSSTTQSLTT